MPPLEGFWWQDDVEGIDYSNKDTFNWISVIRLPDFIAKKDFNWAVEIRNAYLQQNGYASDMNDERLHHKIYLSDARKVAPEKWKTVIRNPVRKI